MKKKSIQPREVKHNAIQIKQRTISLKVLVSQANMYRSLMDDTELQNFENYVAETSNLSILLTCMKPLIAIVAITFPLCLLPLPPVEKGYGKETALLNLCSGIGTLTTILILEHFFTELKKHPNVNARRFLISAFGGILYVLTAGTLTAYACNPFPFVMLVAISTTFPPVLLLFCTKCLVPLTKRKDYDKVDFIRSLKAYVWTAICCWLLMLAYPGSLQLYNVLTAGKQIYVIADMAFTVWLFVLRQFLKQNMIYACEFGKRPAPIMASMVANCFHLMFLSITLQSEKQSNGGATVALVLLVDLAGHLFSFFELYFIKKSCSKEISWDKNSKYDAHVTRTKKRLLPNSEDLMLIEFLECLVPIIMGGFLWAITTFNWNQKYFSFYKNMTEKDASDALMLLGIYASLEIVMLIFLLILIPRKLGIPVWHQLGYSLDKNMGFVVTLTSSWLLYALTMGVDHFHSKWDFSCDEPPLTSEFRDFFDKIFR